MEPAMASQRALPIEEPVAPIAAPDERTGPPGPPPDSDMVWIPGGTFRMGSDSHYPEERPTHRVTVDGFWMDRSPVTNERFARFIAATRHTTFAELPPNPKDYPGALPELMHPGSLVFVKPPQPRQLVAVHPRRGLAASAGARQLAHFTFLTPRRARRIQRCRSVRTVGGQTAADGGRVGVRCARRTRWCRVRVGRRVHAERS